MNEHGIYIALLNVQKKIGAIPKEAENPHFRSKYADLSSILDHVLPVLNDEGIVLIQRPMGIEDGRLSLQTILRVAETGSELVTMTEVPLAKADPQGMGSTVTYARRYALGPLLALRTEDDDGNAGSLPNGQREAPKSYAPPANRPAPAPATNGEPMLVDSVTPRQTTKSGKMGPWKIVIAGVTYVTFSDSIGNAAQGLLGKPVEFTAEAQDRGEPKLMSIRAAGPLPTETWDPVKFRTEVNKLAFRLDPSEFDVFMSEHDITGLDEITNPNFASWFYRELKKLADASERR